MKKEINSIETDDCIITILNNAPIGFEEMKSIVFSFNDPNFFNLLDLPNLKYIDIIRSNNDLSFHLAYDPLREFFNNFIEGFEKTIKKSDKGKEIVERINKSLRDLIKIAEKDMGLSLTACMGLYGELLVLRKLLLINTDHSKILDGWNRPAPANHDFDYDNEDIEIKTISKDNTTVKITSVFQLEAPVDKKLYLQVYRLEVIDGSAVDSLGDLYSEIKVLLKNDSLREEFRVKCINDGIKYGGPSIVTLPYKFISIENMRYLVDQTLFPRINRQTLPNSISNISYRIDLSAIESFKLNENSL